MNEKNFLQLDKNQNEKQDEVSEKLQDTQKDKSKKECGKLSLITFIRLTTNKGP